MAAPVLASRPSLAIVRQEIVFTKARLLARASTKALSAPYVAMQKRVVAVEQEQNEVWDAQTIADAACSAADADMDEFIIRFHRAVEEVAGNKKTHPAYALYFSEPAYKLAAPVLGDELEAMHAWLRAAPKEKNAKLKALLDELAPLVKAGDDAVAARAEAATAAQTFRATGGYAELVASLIALRDQTSRALEEIAEGAGLSRGYARSFFRARPRKVAEEVKAEKAAAKAAERAAKEEKKKAVKAAQDQVKAALAGLKKARGG